MSTHPARASSLKDAVWFKSSYSNGGGNCIEVAQLPRHVAVRDSKTPDDAPLTFSSTGWLSFVAAV